MLWLRAINLDTARLTLEPLHPEHATEMSTVLAAPELYEFTGGTPLTPDDLHSRYQRQSVGYSPAGDAGWLNWVIRVKDTKAAVGYVQATLVVEDNALTADIAWLITPSAQGRGIATEASAVMLAWLLSQHVARVRAFIRPDHHASVRVGQRLGLIPTSAVVDGEVLWELPQ